MTLYINANSYDLQYKSLPHVIMDSATLLLILQLYHGLLWWGVIDNEGMYVLVQVVVYGEYLYLPLIFPINVNSPLKIRFKKAMIMHINVIVLEFNVLFT